MYFSLKSDLVINQEALKQQLPSPRGHNESLFETQAVKVSLLVNCVSLSVLIYKYSHRCSDFIVFWGRLNK